MHHIGNAPISIDGDDIIVRAENRYMPKGMLLILNNSLGYII